MMEFIQRTEINLCNINSENTGSRNFFSLILHSSHIHPPPGLLYELCVCLPLGNR